MWFIYKQKFNSHFIKKNTAASLEEPVSSYLGGGLLFIARTINNTKIHMDCNVIACGTYNYHHTSKL